MGRRVREWGLVGVCYGERERERARHDKTIEEARRRNGTGTATTEERRGEDKRREGTSALTTRSRYPFAKAISASDSLVGVMWSVVGRWRIRRKRGGGEGDGRSVAAVAVAVLFIRIHPHPPHTSTAAHRYYAPLAYVGVEGDVQHALLDLAQPGPEVPGQHELHAVDLHLGVLGKGVSGGKVKGRGGWGASVSQ